MAALQQILLAGSKARVRTTNRYYNSGSISIPVGVTEVTLLTRGGTGTYTPGKGDDRTYETYRTLRVSSNDADYIQAPYGVPINNLALYHQYNIPVYEDWTLGGGYIGTVPMSWMGYLNLGNIYQFFGLLNGVYYQGYIIPDGPIYQELSGGSPATPDVYTTGANTITTLNGATITANGGYGTIAVVRTDVITVPATGNSVNFTIASDGFVEVSYLS